MKHAHVTPEEAVKAFEDLRADVLIPMHYGSFMLADDTPKEALARLQAAWAQKTRPQQLHVLAHGETLIGLS